MNSKSHVAEPADIPDPDEDQIQSSNGSLRLFLLVLVPILAILIALFFYFRGGRYVSTENAYVKSNIVAISSDVSGRAVEVLVKENQRIRKGDVLFNLDANPLKLDVRQAEVQMDVARAEIEALRVEHSEALVSVAEAESKVEYLWREFERQKSLKKQGLGGGQAHDEARFELRAAQQRVAVLKERARKSLATFNGNPDLPVEQHPGYLQASVAQEMALSQLAKTSIVAPADGIASNVQLQAGEYVRAGTAVFSLIENNHVWVEANLKETQLTHVEVGQQARLRVDAYPDAEWQATVSSIAPATGAQFTLLPPQNATGNWVKVVQRVPVNLQVEALADAPVLRAGMTVSVRIDTEQQRRLPLLFGSLIADDARAESPPVKTQTTQQPLQKDVEKTKPTGEQNIESAIEEQVVTDQKTAGLVVLVEEQSPEIYTLEFARTNDVEELKTLFDKLPSEEAVMLYQLRKESEDEAIYGLAAGLFMSKVQAEKALMSLAEVAKRYHPMVRKIGEIQRELPAR